MMGLPNWARMSFVVSISLGNLIGVGGGGGTRLGADGPLSDGPVEEVPLTSRSWLLKGRVEDDSWSLSFVPLPPDSSWAGLALALGSGSGQECAPSPLDSNLVLFSGTFEVSISPLGCKGCVV